jgi:hypothetical protein
MFARRADMELAGHADPQIGFLEYIEQIDDRPALQQRVFQARKQRRFRQRRKWREVNPSTLLAGNLYRLVLGYAAIEPF